MKMWNDLGKRWFGAMDLAFLQIQTVAFKVYRVHIGFPVAMAEGQDLFPSRTHMSDSPASMVLYR